MDAATQAGLRTGGTPSASSAWMRKAWSSAHHLSIMNSTVLQRPSHPCCGGVTYATAVHGGHSPLYSARRLRRLVAELFPFDRPAERLDAQHHVAVLEQPHGAARFTHRHGDGLGGSADRRRCPVTGAQPFGQG